MFYPPLSPQDRGLTTTAKTLPNGCRASGSGLFSAVGVRYSGTLGSTAFTVPLPVGNPGGETPVRFGSSSDLGLVSAESGIVFVTWDAFLQLRLGVSVSLFDMSTNVTT